MLADVARARVRADVEALRIAEAYSRDPLLKHLSIPRFRLPEMVVDLPVLVTGVDATTGEPWKAGEPTKTEIVKAVREGLEKSEIRLTKAQSTAVTDAVVARSKELFASDAPGRPSPGTVAHELASEAGDVVKAKLRKDPSAAEMATLSNATKAAVSSLVASKLVPSPTTEIAFTSEEIKAHGDSANVVRLRLTISEDSYEVVNDDDGPGYYLTPE
jgi:hypothetical protein